MTQWPSHIANRRAITHIRLMAKTGTYRSALTGRLVPAPASKSTTITVRDAQGFALKVSKSKGQPSTLVGKYATEPRSTKEGGTYRSAISGKFVTSAFGARHPQTTVKESSGRKKG